MTCARSAGLEPAGHDGGMGEQSRRSEERLLAAARQGDEAAFEQLDEQSFTRTATACSARTRMREDALQESLFAAWKGLGVSVAMPVSWAFASQ